MKVSRRQRNEVEDGFASGIQCLRELCEVESFKHGGQSIFQPYRCLPFHRRITHKGFTNEY